MRNPWRDVYDSPECVNPWDNPPSFALYLEVEPTNECNFQCVFCAGRQSKRPKGYMKQSVFEEACQQAAMHGAKGVRIFGWGESFLHPDIFKFVAYAKSLGLLTHITTNGSLLVGRMDDLMSSGLDSLLVSFQGLGRAGYTEMRGKNFSRLGRDVMMLMDERPETMHVGISTTTLDEPQEEIDAFRVGWEGVVDSVSMGKTWFDLLKNKAKIKKYLSRQQPLAPCRRCKEVLTKLSIHWDGSIALCCLDYDHTMVVGQLPCDLGEIWNSPEAEAVRVLLSDGHQGMFELCKDCRLNYPFKGAAK